MRKTECRKITKEDKTGFADGMITFVENPR
jgi:hypothetical protein